MSTDYRPRLSIDLTEHQRKELDRILYTHGFRRAVFSVIIDDLIESVNRHGPDILSGLLARAIKLEDLSKELKDYEY